MNAANKLIRPTELEKTIFLLRNKRVMLDADLAMIYGVTTKRLNEQVKRNIKRFPGDFMFQLSKEEKAKVVANCDHLSNLKYSPHLPFAFTEHGAVMLASVLNSEIAIEASTYVVRAFVKLKEIASTHLVLMKQIENMERKYDTRFHIIFKAIKGLLTPPKYNNKKRKMGFDIDL